MHCRNSPVPPATALSTRSFPQLPDLLLSQPRPAIPIPVNSASIPGQQNRRLALRMQAPALRTWDAVLRFELACGLADGVPEVAFVAGHFAILNFVSGSLGGRSF